MKDVHMENLDQSGMQTMHESQFQPLRSERYISDLAFRKEGLYIHILKNMDSDKTISNILLQDFYPRNIRPVMHSVQINHQKGKKVEAINYFDPRIEMAVNYNEFSDSTLILKTKNLTLQPGEQLMLTFRVTKSLRNFEEYPNDVSRGFNIPHTPIFYTLDGEKQQAFSTYMLIMTPEPDFSMPFNVNAVTHMLIGTLFVNTVFAIIKDPEEKKEEESKEEGEAKKVEEAKKEEESKKDK